jgi:hypothetical protein
LENSWLSTSALSYKCSFLKGFNVEIKIWKYFFISWWVFETNIFELNLSLNLLSCNTSLFKTSFILILCGKDIIKTCSSCFTFCHIRHHLTIITHTNSSKYNSKNWWENISCWELFNLYINYSCKVKNESVNNHNRCLRQSLEKSISKSFWFC